MFTITDKKLLQLGERLKEARLNLNDPQKEFAYRIGVSVPTLYKMEKGDPSIAIGKWAKALEVLSRIDDLDLLLKPKTSLFDEAEMVNKKPRKRARRKKYD